MMPPTRLVLLAMSATVLVASGCGSGTSTNANDSHSGATTGGGTTSNVATGSSSNASNREESKQLTREQLTANANPICKRVHAQLRALSTGHGKQDAEHLFLRSAAYERAGLAELQKLSPPADLEADWKQILTAMSTLVGDSMKYAEYAKAKNLNAAGHVVNSYTPIKEPAVAVAMRDHLAECAQAL
jgi:hypothetical protein